MLSCEFCEISKNTFFAGRLLPDCGLSFTVGKSVISVSHVWREAEGISDTEGRQRKIWVFKRPLVVKEMNVVIIANIWLLLQNVRHNEVLLRFCY